MVLLAAGCGKKGPPLPPFTRVPAPVVDLEAKRQGEDVLLQFTVRDVNNDGVGPADLARVEVWAVTADEQPRGFTLADRRDRELASLVASLPVRRPLPPLPPLPEGAPPVPALPVEPPGEGVDQGARAAVRETLAPEDRVLVELPLSDEERRAAAAAATDVEPLAGPLVFPADGQLPRRYYYAVGVNRRDQYGPTQEPVAVPLGQVAGPPSAPRVTHDASTLTIEWTPSADARTSQIGPPLPPGNTQAAAPGNTTAPANASPAAPASADIPVLDARPVVPSAPATRYNVYQVPEQPVEAAAPGALAVESPINDEPLATTSFTLPDVQFGVTRCFAVRAVDALGGTVVEGPASEAACVTPKDTFPPAAPASLAAVAASGAISLIWDSNTEGDIAGYIVLRGEAPGSTLQPLTPDPIQETTFRDERVTPGTRYVYAVIAVDTAGNPSGQSNRVEETARQ